MILDLQLIVILAYLVIVGDTVNQFIDKTRCIRATSFCAFLSQLDDINDVIAGTVC